MSDTTIEDFLLQADFRYVTGWTHDVPAGRNHEHTHPDYEIVYHPEGTGAIHSPGREPVVFLPGSITIHMPDVVHAQFMETRGRDICLRLAGPPIPPCPAGTIRVPVVPGRRVKEELQSLSANHGWTGGTEARILDLRATALMIALIAESLKQDPKREKPSAWLHAEHGHRLIVERLQSIGNVEEIARELNLSADYFRHVFTEKYGLGPRQFLVQIRLQRAAELLAHSSLPTKEIARQCGFTTDRYFCTSFRRFTGATPATFRKTRSNHGSMTTR